MDGPHAASTVVHSNSPSLSSDNAAAILEGQPATGYVDDRDQINPGDRVVLIVEDDTTFGEILLGLARSSGLKGVLSSAGAGTLALARRLMPDAITLDLGLSDIDGWVLFDLLRNDPKTRGVPIYVISGAGDTSSLLRQGASGVSTKPVMPDDLRSIFEGIRERKVRTQRTVLVADAEPDRRLSLVDEIRDGLTSVTAVAEIRQGTEAAPSAYDVIVLGFGRSAKENAQILADAAPHLESVLPRLLIFASSMESLDQALLQNPAFAAVPRALNFSQLTQLLSEALPEAGADLSELPERLDTTDLAGAKVLIVDDDIRNIYSLTSVLETYEIQVLHAERGREGIAILEHAPDTDVALIDIMMPEMDGYETMREIRRNPAIAQIPLISVTAKAMKGDRQKCLDAGASDYIAKPVDIDLLLALLRVWVARSRSRSEARAAEPHALIN
jgi:CheY-like chemotaxis protein